MRRDKRLYTGTITVIAEVLTGLVIYDIYDDWIIDGHGLQLAMFENSVPLAVGLVLCYLPYWMHTNANREQAATMTKWTVLGLGGFVLITGWVTSIQIFEQELQPLIVLTHTAVGGAVAGGLVGYNVAKRDEIKEAIETEKQRFESLFSNAPSAVADLQYTDRKPVVQRANTAFEELLGYTSEDASGESLFDIVPLADESTEKTISAHVSRGEIYQGGITVQRENDVGYYKLRVIPYEVGKKGERAYALYTDVTELNKTKRELEESVTQLEKSNDRLQQFAYIASHDLQEPLRMVSGYMSLLESEYKEELDDEAQEYIEFAVDGADRMIQMVDGLLAYSRIRTEGKEFAEVHAETTFQEVTRDLAVRIEESGATVTHDELPALHADKAQLRQLFQNLIENAIDHGGESPEIHVSSQQYDNRFVFSVSDDGPGIPEPQQEKIFDLFKQGSRSESNTGIGLAICDRIAGRHDGEIWVESDVGEGTTVYFSIPRS